MRLMIELNKTTFGAEDVLWFSRRWGCLLVVRFRGGPKITIFDWTGEHYKYLGEVILNES